VYFKVQQQADVLAFSVGNFKAAIVNDPSAQMTENMMEFSRAVN
jgi:hypothetical protein